MHYGYCGLPKRFGVFPGSLWSSPDFPREQGSPLNRARDCRRASKGKIQYEEIVHRNGVVCPSLCLRFGLGSSDVQAASESHSNVVKLRPVERWQSHGSKFRRRDFSLDVRRRLPRPGTGRHVQLIDRNLGRRRDDCDGTDGCGWEHESGYVAKKYRLGRSWTPGRRLRP